MDNINLDLDEEFLKKFFGLTDKVITDSQEVTLLALKNQLKDIESAFNDSKNMIEELKEEVSKAKSAPTPTPARPEILVDEPVKHVQSLQNEEVVFNLPSKTILVIDDLGVITYQLSVLFKQAGFEVTTSKEIYDAIEKFKKQNFNLVIMDLFIPTEREGFLLLEELKKIAANKQKNVKIGIMSASPKKEHKQLCKIKGAEFYIEKVDDWQKELFQVIKELR